MLYNVSETDRTPALDSVMELAIPMMTEHSDNLSFNKGLYERIAQLYKGDQSSLTREQQMVLKKHYEEFERNGVGLSEEKQARLKEINSEIASKTQKIGNNILEESNAFKQKFGISVSDYPNAMTSTTDRAKRKEMLEAKRQQVITYIAANAINPQTHTPHPPLRIELALEEAKFHVDAFKPLEKEIEEAMKVLRPLIPIRFEKSRIAIKLKGSDYGRCYDDIIHYGIVEHEVWTPEGDWIGSMEIPAGIITELTEKLKHKTKGSASVKLMSN